ncbi:MAG: rhomboid family intramembrane serine protease [Calditrichaeota bacterium]|nr:MAG: rhomboid family intramembrane serine protease [Calditrichota bacterium]
MKLKYNAPFVLTYALISAGLMLYVDITGNMAIMDYFITRPGMSFSDPMTYVRLVSHVIGHANWEHLASNFTFILLLGPMLEEKYGTLPLLVMSVITAVVTGVLNNFFFSTGLMGASGIVFMMILLSSFANVKAGTIPLTFILILVLFLGQEFMRGFDENNISELAHIVGGVVGSFFGFARTK